MRIEEFMWVKNAMNNEVSSYEIWEKSKNKKVPHRRQADIQTCRRIKVKTEKLTEKDIVMGKYEPNLARKEVKVLSILVKEMLTNLVQITIPEYWRCISVNEELRPQLVPYIEKCNKLQGLLLNLQNTLQEHL
jgi:hypothetical protein